MTRTDEYSGEDPENFVRLPIDSPRRMRIEVDNLCKKCIYLDGHYYCDKHFQVKHTTDKNYICITHCSGFQEEQETIASIGNWVLCRYP